MLQLLLRISTPYFWVFIMKVHFLESVRAFGLGSCRPRLFW